MVSLTLPKSAPSNASPESTQDEVTPVSQQAGGDDAAAEEAQEIMEGIKDSPKVCEMLYEMLKDKYESGDKNPDEGDGGDDKEMNMDDLPE